VIALVFFCIEKDLISRFLLFIKKGLLLCGQSSESTRECIPGELIFLLDRTEFFIENITFEFLCSLCASRGFIRSTLVKKEKGSIRTQLKSNTMKVLEEVLPCTTRSLAPLSKKTKKRSLAHILQFCSHGALHRLSRKGNTERTKANAQGPSSKDRTQVNEWASDHNDRCLLLDITQILKKYVAIENTSEQTSPAKLLNDQSQRQDTAPKNKIPVHTTSGQHGVMITNTSIADLLNWNRTRPDRYKHENWQELDHGTVT
jgi:hypothetical protein